MNIRLSSELLSRLDRLAEAMPGLSRSQILRLLLASSLEGSIEEQVARVTEQIVNAKSLVKHEPRNRLNSTRKGH